MSLARLLAMSRKEAIQLRRDPRSLLMAFMLPVLLILFFGYAISFDVKNIELGILDQSNTAASRDLVERFESAFERIEMATEDHRTLQRLLLTHAHDHAPDLRARIEAEAGPGIIEKLFSLNHVKISPALRRKDDTDLAELCLAEELAKLDASRGVRREVEEATEEIDALADEGLTFRLSEAAKARAAAAKGRGEDKQLYDRADNGVLIAREEKDALDALLEEIDYAKSKPPPS